ncbi:MAG: peptidylprolyl isomerase [Planctomycetes bacterium]|nr:peptidylprolyl isomerase [Planctomycetota bacterium]
MADDGKTEGKGDRFTPDEVIATQRNRQLFVLSGVIIVLAALVYLTTTFKDTESPLKDVPLVGGTLDDPAFAKEDVKQIELWVGAQGDRLAIARDGKQWRVPSRFNAPADESDVDALLLQVFAAKRLNRAGTETESQYVNYRLSDAQGVHLRLTDDKGGELLHVMVGRGETGARDFVRLMGDGTDPGIFELTGAGGDFNTLYSTLNLDADGAPQAKGWISTKGFQTMPFTAVAQSLAIKDGDSTLVFKRKQGADETEEAWELTEPHVVPADGAEVRAVIDALMNYNASDIAGRDTDATGFGFMESGREIALTYSDESNIRTVRLYFGRLNDDNEVAVWLKSEDKGEYIYWAGDFILSRLFRPKADFVKKQRVSPYPDGADIDNITILDDGALLELAREKQGSVVNWKLLQPWASPGSQIAVSGLLVALNTLQGYRTGGEADYDALGVSPGLATRVITLRYIPRGVPDDSDGQDETDPPDGQPPADTELAHETATLYFGKTRQGEVPMLRISGDKTDLYWLSETVLERLFRPAIDFAMPKAFKPVPEGWTLSEVRRVNDGKVGRMVHKPVAEDGGKRWMLGDGDDEMANQTEAAGLIRDLNALEGIGQATLDKQEYGLGEGLSARMIDLRLTRDESTQVVSLYFGKSKWDRVTLMIASEGAEQFYLVAPSSVDALFSRVLKDYNVKVRHILISWAGKNPRVTPMDPDRTKEQATALANELLERFRNGEEFTELQKTHNEDSADPTAVYDVDPRSQWVPEFKELSSRLEVGEADIVESDFGYHIITRIE